MVGVLRNDVLVDLSALGRSQHLGLADLIGRRRHNADPGVAVGVHEPQRDDAVEPRVGDLVSDVRLPLVAAASASDGPLQRGHRLRLLDALRRSLGEHRGDPRGHLADELGARRGGERLERCGFHQSVIRFPSLRVCDERGAQCGEVVVDVGFGFEDAGDARDVDRLDRHHLLRRRRTVAPTLRRLRRDDSSSSG